MSLSVAVGLARPVVVVVIDPAEEPESSTNWPSKGRYERCHEGDVEATAVRTLPFEPA